MLMFVLEAVQGENLTSIFCLASLKKNDRLWKNANAFNATTRSEKNNEHAKLFRHSVFLSQKSDAKSF